MLPEFQSLRTMRAVLSRSRMPFCGVRRSRGSEYLLDKLSPATQLNKETLHVTEGREIVVHHDILPLGLVQQILH